MKTPGNWVLRYGMGLLLGLGAAYAYLAGRVSGVDAFLALPAQEQYLLLCDAFTLPGVLMLMVGGLVALSNAGALDALGYVLHYVVLTLIPGRGKVERYLDYVEGKREKKVKGYGFLFVVGGILTAVALVFLALFYSAYPQ